MALTIDELRAKQASDLQRLVASLMEARRTGEASRLDGALGMLTSFQADTPFPTLQEEAERARSAAVSDLTAVALEELAAVGERAASAGAGFKAAAMAAESGKTELFFPALAATTAKTLQLMQEFRSALDTVRGTVSDLDQLGDVPDGIDGVLTSLEQLSESVDSLA